MRERPILFSAPMVRALLNGSKTQTRRIVKPDVASILDDAFLYADRDHIAGLSADPAKFLALKSPFDVDRLWVRETWAYNGQASRNTGPKDKRREGYASYAADGAKVTHYFGDGPMLTCPTQTLPTQREDEDEWEFISRKDEYISRYFRRWRPSIHMPRWASRIALEVTKVRVERLDAITDADASAEGIQRVHGFDVPAAMGQLPEGTWSYPNEENLWWTNPVSAYRALWTSIHGPGSWAINPWVWVVEFKRAVSARPLRCLVCGSALFPREPDARGELVCVDGYACASRANAQREDVDPSRARGLALHCMRTGIPRESEWRAMPGTPCRWRRAGRVALRRPPRWNMSGRRKHAGGRPSQGISEATLLIRAPRELLDLVRAAAEREGIPQSEWVRTALHQALVRIPRRR